jgi:hypothetical protein
MNAEGGGKFNPATGQIDMDSPSPDPRTRICQRSAAQHRDDELVNSLDMRLPRAEDV